MTTNSDELEKLQNGNLHDNAAICKGMDKTAPQKKPLGERRKAVLRQELMVFFANTGVLAGGMAMALPSATLSNLTNPAEPFYLTTDEASWFSSINSMACPLGGILVGFLMDRIGRKKTMLVFNIIGVLGWALLAAAPLNGDREAIYIQMLVARFIKGLFIGLCVSPPGVYSAEISLPSIRGRLILGTSIAIAAGILFMYVLGFFIRNNWQLICIISGIYQLISAICVLPMPESPSWLMQKGRVEQARQSLKFFRGLKKNDTTIYDEFETELAQIKKTADSSRTSAENESLLKAVRTPEVYKPLILMISFFGFQQFAGVVVIVVFAAQIATTAGVSIDPVLCAVLVGVARLVTTFFMSTILESWGRRAAGMISAAGMAVCMLALAVCGWYPAIAAKVSFLPVISIVLYIISSTMGLLTLPFFMISEVFPQRVRGSASGITVCFGLLISFLVIKVYPSMTLAWGTHNVFAFYGLVSLLAVAFIYFFIPETRGRTLIEIEEYFRSGRRLSSKKPLAADVEMKEVFIKN